MTESPTQYDYRSGDVLLIKIIKKRKGKPAMPSGEVYSEREFYLFGGDNPVYNIYDVGDTVPMRLMKHKGDLSARYTEPSKSNKNLFQDWIKLQKRRLDHGTSIVELNDIPDDFDPNDIKIKEGQDADDNKETSEFDEWTESKSERMGDLL